METDVVVIGAGMGGLTSAALLAKAGLRVRVLEAEAHVGGYLAGFRRKGFRFDTAIHWLNQCGPGGFVRRVFDLLGPGSPETRPLERIRRYRGTGYDYLLTNRPDELRAELLRDFPNEARGIAALFDLARKLEVSLRGLQSRMRSIETRGLLDKTLFGLDMLRLNWRIIRYNRWSTHDGLEAFFAGEAIRRLFKSEEDFLACVVPIAWAYGDDYQVPPAGGSSAFPRWLAEVLAGWDVTVETGCRVEEVLLEGRRAVGVRFRRGKRGPVEEVRCRYVVAACDVEALFERMLPAGAVPDDLLQRLRRADLYDSSVTISLGIDCDPRELGFDEELVSLVRDELTPEERQSADPEKADLSVLAPSLRDPTLAPAGQGTLTIYVKANIRFADAWKTGPDYERGPEYRAFKEQYTDTVLRRVEEALAPGLGERIVIRDTATPVTHWRWTGNRDGSIMGARPSSRNIRSGIAGCRTPIENLLLGGMWAEYGGGVPVAVRAGVNSALIVLRREQPAAFARMRDVIDGKVDPAVVSGAAPLRPLAAGAADVRAS